MTWNKDNCNIEILLFSDMASLNLNEGSSGGGSDQDGLAPLPPPGPNPLPLGGQPYPYHGYPTPPPGFPPGYSDPCHSFHSGSAGSQQSEGWCLCVRHTNAVNDALMDKRENPFPRSSPHTIPWASCVTFSFGFSVPIDVKKQLLR